MSTPERYLNTMQGLQTPGARGRLDDCIRTMDIHAKASASADRIEASIEARVKAHWFWGKDETDPLKPQRVCSKCFDLLLPMQPYLTATLSKAVQLPDFSEPSLKEWAGKPISRSFKLEIKKAVHNLNAFLGMPDDTVVRRLLDTAHGVALLSVVLHPRTAPPRRHAAATCSARNSRMHKQAMAKNTLFEQFPDLPA